MIDWGREEFEEWKRQGFPPSKQLSNNYDEEPIKQFQDLDEDEDIEELEEFDDENEC